MKTNISYITDVTVMISPDQFGFNPQTAKTNVFQHKLSISEKELQQKAMKEFTTMVSVLKQNGITILVLKSRLDVITPDAVFPNNWFSHHANNTLVLYPMLAPNRQAERQPKALQKLLGEVAITNSTVLDLSTDENNGDILEGTGSLVLDREHKVAFAMQSPRTVEKEFIKWCNKMNYEGIFFHAYDGKKVPIYHTNVLMAIGNEFVVICMEGISNKKERELLKRTFKKLHKEIIPISIKQMTKFCGNILQVKNDKGESFMIMSKNAFRAFSQKQKKQLRKYGKIVSVEIPTIEATSGGSARCMMAEVYRI